MKTFLATLFRSPSSPKLRRLRPAPRTHRLRFEALEVRALVTHVIGDHIHPTLRIVLEGIDVTIPADVGLTPTRTYHPHTHDATGTLHIGEGPVTGIDPLGSAPRLTTLKDFFDVWRTTNPGTSRNNPDAFFSQNQILDRIADAQHEVRMTVNGQPNFEFESYSPHDLDQIVISYVALLNGQPIAHAQTVSVPFGLERSITLSGDDGDPDVEQPLSFRINSLPSGGTLRTSAGAAITVGQTLPSANVTYTPAAQFAGADSFTFVALDGGTSGTSEPATVTLNVAPNSAPTANPQSVDVRVNMSRQITLSGDDGEPNLTQSLSFRIQTLPASGTLQDSNGAAVTSGAALPSPLVTYVPNAGFGGDDHFTFLVQDNGGTAAGGQDTSSVAQVDLHMVNSLDPNDLLGPEGVGDERWVAPDEALSFTIRFENYAAATAPAQEIVVQAALDDDLDWSTFRFGEMGFGQTRIDVPPGSQMFGTMAPMPQPDGSSLNVTIEARLEDGVASWRLLALDSETGALPENPLAGFLPPNRAHQEGEGFLQFTVQPRADRESAARIDVSASITFDTNRPVATNELFYTVPAAH